MKFLAVLLISGLTSCSGMKWKTSHVSKKNTFDILPVMTTPKRGPSSTFQIDWKRIYKISSSEPLSLEGGGTCKPVLGGSLKVLKGLGSSGKLRYSVYYDGWSAEIGYCDPNSYLIVEQHTLEDALTYPSTVKAFSNLEKQFKAVLTDTSAVTSLKSMAEIRKGDIIYSEGEVLPLGLKGISYSFDLKKKDHPFFQTYLLENHHFLRIGGLCNSKGLPLKVLGFIQKNNVQMHDRIVVRVEKSANPLRNLDNSCSEGTHFIVYEGDRIKKGKN